MDSSTSGSKVYEDVIIATPSFEFTPSKSSTVEEIVETIAAMCHQEDTAYYVIDYLQAPLCYDHEEDDYDKDDYQQQRRPVKHVYDIDRECRKKMVAWSYQVIDFCKFNRETVEIAMSNLDRFLMSPTGREHALYDRSIYQLAAMTSLYTAVKIHEPEAMDPSLVSNLSRGTYSCSEIEEMEFILLQSLSWRCNPPTTMSFIRQFFQLISHDAIDIATRKIIYELCKYQCEYATSNHDYIAMKASDKAYYSFMNTLVWLGYDTNVIQYISVILQNTIQLSATTPTTATINYHNHSILQTNMYNAILQHPTILAAESKLLLLSSPKPTDGSSNNKSMVVVSNSPRSSIVSMAEI